MAAPARFGIPLKPANDLAGLVEAQHAADHVYKGRPTWKDAAKVRELKAAGMGATKIATTLNIGRAWVYRLLSEAK